MESAAAWPPPRGARHTQTQSGRISRRPVAGFYSAVDAPPAWKPQNYLSRPNGRPFCRLSPKPNPPLHISTGGPRPRAAPVRGRARHVREVWPGQINNGRRWSASRFRERNPDKRIIHVIWDNAAYHKGPDVRASPARTACRIHLIQLPPYYPHLNPMERLWTVLHQYVTHNRYY